MERKETTDYFTTNDKELIAEFFNRPSFRGRVNPEFVASCKTIGIVRDSQFPYQYCVVGEIPKKTVWFESKLGWDDVERWATERGLKSYTDPSDWFDWAEYDRYNETREIPYEFTITDPALMLDFFEHIRPEYLLTEDEIVKKSVISVAVTRYRLDKANIYYRVSFDHHEYRLSLGEEWDICYEWAKRNDIPIETIPADWEE